MTMQHEAITLEQFQALDNQRSRGRPFASPLMHCLGTFKCGDAVIMEHGEYMCRKTKSGQNCYVTQAAARYAKQHGWTSRTKHLPDGRVAIAFLPKREPAP